MEVKTYTYRSRIKQLLLVICALGLIAPAQAQQEAAWTMYQFNTLAINPAYVGSREVANIMFHTRQQWLDMPGAPRTNLLSLQLPTKKQFGLGLSLINDKAGPQTANSLYVDFAFTFNINKNTKLSLGAKGGLDFYKAELSKVTTVDQFDNNFASDVGRSFMPNLGAGVFVHSNKYYVGLSTPKLIKHKVSVRSTDYETLAIGRQELHYYFVAGYVMKLGESDIVFKPSMQAKLVQGAPTSLDLTGTFIISDLVWLAANYRYRDAIGGIVRLNIAKRIWLAAAYEVSLSKLMKYNNGSVEVILSYDLQNATDKIKLRSPRYF